MGKQALEKKLEALECLRASAGSPDTAAQLAKALGDRNNYAVSKAAALIGEMRIHALAPQLVAAFDRHLAGSAKSDPQCWAKTAIVRALATLGHQDAEVFVHGLGHIQMEPVWGGQADTAAALRGACAVALPGCRLGDFDLLAHLVDALADPDKTVRMEAARSIAQLPRPESALLLRLKALAGDREPEVTGQCLASLLGLAPAESVAFAARFLAADAEVRAEAAMALAQSREPAAIVALKDHWHSERDAVVRRAILGSLAGAVLPEAAEFLLEVVETCPEHAAEALEALAAGRFHRQFAARAAVAAQGSPRLEKVLRERFSPCGER